MSFIGVITNPKNEEYMNNILSNIFSKQKIIFITEKNILEVQEIPFETILVDRKVTNKLKIENIIEKAKYLILNTDLEILLKELNEKSLTVITYGFNNKATLTPSSVLENNMIICLQRIIFDIYGNKYEPQEFIVNTGENIESNSVLGVFAIMLIYGNPNIYPI